MGQLTGGDGKLHSLIVVLCQALSLFISLLQSYF